VDKVLFVDGSQPGGDLACDFQRQLYLQPTGTFDELFECFSLYKLHRVKVVFTGSTQVEDTGYVRVTDANRCAGFAWASSLSEHDGKLQRVLPITLWC
jgi:hypothetical protein